MEYPLMSVNETLKWLPIIEQYKVSQKARSQNGFLTNYLKNDNKILQQSSDQPKYTWKEKRHLFLMRSTPAFIKNPTIRRYLSLISWAYDPHISDPSFYKELIKIKQLLK